MFLLHMSLKIKANILNFIFVRKNNKQYTCTEGKQVSAAKIRYVWIRNSYVVYLTSVSKQLGTRSPSCKIRYFCRSSITKRVVSLRSQVRRLKWARTFTRVNEAKSSTVLFYSGKNHCSRMCLCNRLLFYSKKRRKLIVELLFGSSVAMYL